jgi:colanic acid/amylovoran biosynthesis protein
MGSPASRKTFILAGNGSYFNRGCEAITRGTVRILRRHFGEPEFVAVSSYKNRKQYMEQSRNETDPAIVHRKMIQIYRRFDPMWFAIQSLRLFRPGMIKHIMYREMKPWLSAASAVLSLGGDNYSVYYNRTARNYVYLDDLVLERGRPMVIWGASIGPFSKYPSYEKFMMDHLRRVHILARESETAGYLAGHGLEENVHLVADPAFVMEPVRPPEGLVPEPGEGAVGLNLSPLMARFVTGGDTGAWRRIAGEIVERILRLTEGEVFLIPHVTGVPSNDDYLFMADAMEATGRAERDRVILVPPVLNGPETKWVIGRMSIFAGARTHSTIAALSSGVPTVSFAYSMKARGINRDIYGHLDWCLEPDDMTPDLASETLARMSSERDHVRSHLKGMIPVMEERAFSAGEVLKGILG